MMIISKRGFLGTRLIVIGDVVLFETVSLSLRLALERNFKSRYEVKIRDQLRSSN